MGDPYYAVRASLPPLPYFATASRLPISELRIDERLGMLAARDRAELDRAMDLVRWRRQLPERKDRRVETLYEGFMRDRANRELREFVDYRSGLRAVMGALRMRRRGQDPVEGQLLGFGRWNSLIRRRWGQHDFGLASVYPWIAPARELLDKGDALGLETLLMDTVWRRLQPLEDRYPFRFEGVFAYLFRWDILARWVGFDVTGARARFKDLLREMDVDT